MQERIFWGYCPSCACGESDLGRDRATDHPIRRVLAVIDFTFVLVDVVWFYRRNGHEGVRPAISWHS